MIKSYSLRQSISYQNTYKIYILSAQDEDLLQYETQHIIEQAGIQQIKRNLIQCAEDWNHFYTTSQNYELFPEPTAYVLQLEKNGLSNKAMVDLKPGDEEIYIIQTSSFKHAFLDHLEKNSQTIWYRMYTPSLSELWAWLQQKIKQHALKVSPDLAQWFLQQDGLQWQHCRQLWQKIQLGHTLSTELTPLFIQDLLGDILEDDWQPLIEAWMQNQKVRIQQHFPKIETQIDLSLLIWLLHRNLQVMLALLAQPKNSASIFQQHKVWNKHIALFHQTLGLWNKSRIEKSLCLLHDADKHFKSYRIQQARHALKYLLLESCDA